MRLIDADEIAPKLEGTYNQSMVRYAPEIDAVPVVRCRECKHHHDCETHFCDALGMDCPDDSEFFCSYGERKEGADNES